MNPESIPVSVNEIESDYEIAIITTFDDGSIIVEKAETIGGIIDSRAIWGGNVESGSGW